MKKPKTPAQKAVETDKWTQILFSALAKRAAKRWRFVSFRGVGGREWKGVVDVVAIRKNTGQSKHAVLKTGDLFDIMLIQMKGGTADRPTPADISRLTAVKKHYRASEIILFSWKKGVETKWERWSGSGWTPSSAKKLFGS